MIKAGDLKIGDTVIFEEDGSKAIVKAIDDDWMGITAYFPKTKEEVWIELWQFSKDSTIKL